MKWLHVRIVGAAKKAFTEKNSIWSLYDHDKPLEGKLGLTVITWLQQNGVF